MTNIFLSYRREDSEAETRNIHVTLVQSGYNVFLDRIGIQPGDDERKGKIRSTLQSADIVIAVIGNRWLTSSNPDDGRRRIDGDDDWVRFELRTALETNKTIIPVLINRASMPSPEKLPEDLKDLPNWQALTCTQENWENDLQKLLQRVSAGSKRTAAVSWHQQQAEAGHPDNVSFTAIYPKETSVETWHSLLVYVHLESALEDIRKDAQRLKDNLEPVKESTSSSSTQLMRGTEVRIVPYCEGITFNPSEIKLKWIEDFHRADFRFRADKSLVDDAGKGSITIFVGPLIVGTLKFAMLFNDKAEISLSEKEVRSEMYHKDKIFISYSHKDTDIVLAFKKIHETTGYDILIDIDDLSSGQNWSAELMHMIDCADIFQLFWSENSKKSKYCKQEWKHALNRATEGFIRPVYWQKPLPKPPRELGKFHFQYVDL